MVFSHVCRLLFIKYHLYFRWVRQVFTGRMSVGSMGAVTTAPIRWCWLVALRMKWWVICIFYYLFINLYLHYFTGAEIKASHEQGFFSSLCHGCYDFAVGPGGWVHLHRQRGSWPLRKQTDWRALFWPDPDTHEQVRHLCCHSIRSLKLN